MTPLLWGNERVDVEVIFADEEESEKELWHTFQKKLFFGPIAGYFRWWPFISSHDMSSGDF